MPNIEEKYRHFRSNAEAFVKNMQLSVKVAEDSGDLELASKLKVWALMPWEAAIRDDDSGDLWPVCEACGDPIKDDVDRVSGDACDFHRACLPEVAFPIG